jgi:hypothetical protein
VQQHLTKGLVDNICRIPHIQELNELRKLQKTERIAKLNREIKVLDSVQFYDYFVKDAKVGAVAQTTGSIVLMSESDAAPQTHRVRITEKSFFHEEILKLQHERHLLEKDFLVSLEPVMVIQGFETNLQREGFCMSGQALVFGFLIALFAALAWDNRKRIAEMTEKNR